MVNRSPGIAWYTRAMCSELSTRAHVITHKKTSTKQQGLLNCRPTGRVRIRSSNRVAILVGLMSKMLFDPMYFDPLKATHTVERLT